MTTSVRDTTQTLRRLLDGEHADTRDRVRAWLSVPGNEPVHDLPRDEYRERVLELIERKAAGEEVAVQPMAEEREEVPDLMAALEKTLAEIKG